MNYIVLRYPDYCRGCGNKMNPGSPAAWFGKKEGVKHLNCSMKKKELVEIKLDW
jgi:hypothetical protein